MVTLISQRAFTVSEYYRMVEVGILSEEDHVELIDGKVITMSPIGSRHAACVNRLTSLLSRQVGQTAIVSVQNPIRLSEYSEPLPDLALLSPREDFYAQRHPTPREVLLAIEVADTSEDYDHQIKIPLYARAGIPEVWLVNLAKNLVEIYTQPLQDSYQTIRHGKRGEVITSQHLTHLQIPIEAILG